MALLDAPFRLLAKTLINVLGAPATLQRSAVGGYSPVSGVAAPPVMTSYPVKVSPPESYTKKEVDAADQYVAGESAIRSTDFHVYLAASAVSVVPDPSTDLLLFNGKTYKIVRVVSIYSGASEAAFDLQVRL